MTRARRWLADRLASTAQRLDPGRPVVRYANGGWTITVYGLPLAIIRTHQVDDHRPQLRPPTSFYEQEPTSFRPGGPVHGPGDPQ